MTTSNDRPKPSMVTIAEVLFTASDSSSSEVCWIGRNPSGWAVEGHVVVRFEHELAAINYSIDLDDRWQTSVVSISQQQPAGDKSLVLRSTRGSWTVDGSPRPDLDGCYDIDLGVTPATNTLPIRRLGLNAGEAADVDAVWVRFPSLDVSRLAQRYTRLSDSLWRYESDGGFVAELRVDEFGIVTHYEGGWTGTRIVRPNQAG